jgi:RecQ family ATP-dependent DNA helicase
MQEDIIRSVLDGKDTLALLPTGGGKSICFQVPAMAKDGICLVISPLIALMKDQVENLRRKSITAFSIFSGMTRKEVINTLELTANSNCKFLYVSPERLETKLFLEYLPILDIKLIAVDESHCISQWGYDFRPPYLRIKNLREQLPGVPVLALTASATPAVQDDICEKLGLVKPAIFRQSFARPNLSYSVFKVESKLNRILDILRKVNGSGIVYCRSRKRTKEISDLLLMHGIKADFYHAGLSQEQRNQKQEDWIQDRTRIIACTNAFGMGIDKPTVRIVVHADVPDCLENYYQEAGRAGRDGLKSYAALLYDKNDIDDLRELPVSRYPPLDTIRKMYSELMNFLQIPSGSGEGQYFNFDLPAFIRQKRFDTQQTIACFKTLQVISEALSNASVPVLLMDIKGDLSGIAAPGTSNPTLEERMKKIGIPFTPAKMPVELLTLSNQPGVRLRATVLEFGPILVSKILGLNDTQEGVVSMIFKYCDDNKLPLVDLKDFIRVLQFVSNEGKVSIEKDYGKISTTSTGTILRKVIELQQQGADLFFGEPSFDVNDLMRISDDGRGVISVLRVTDMQTRPKLFSTFMLSLLAELYATLPEEGDMEKPKLVLFIDEAHLVFQEATSALLQQIETIIKLIRSKGVGIFFCTQNPQDIPASVLAQLGLKVQHALRAFTAADRKVIKQAAENYPETSFYQVDDLLTQLGIGEAFVTGLNEKGIPTPLIHTLLVSPSTRMDVLTDTEISTLVGSSRLASKYANTVDGETAYEILNEKLSKSTEAEEEEEVKPAKRTTAKAEKSTLETILDSSVTKQVGRTAASVITRGLLGALGLGGRTSKKKKSTSWF